MKSQKNQLENGKICAHFELKTQCKALKGTVV